MKDPKLWRSRQPAGRAAGEGAADRGGEGRPMRELRTVAGKDARDADDGGAWRKGTATA